MKEDLSDDELRLALEEIAKRQTLQVGISNLSLEITGEMFQQQRDFCADKTKRKAVLGSRRAGKTAMWARYATITALANPRALVRIWHSSRARAKDMLWAELNWLHSRHGIVVKSNETELSMTFDNGAVIRLVGADKDKEAQKKRGDKTVLEIILEVQNFGGFLRSMIDDVIDPSLVDLQGTLCVEGTPGALCQGIWYEISGDDNFARRWKSKRGGWSCHRWTLLDNPHIPHARQYLADKKLERHWGDDNPTYLREFCGQWVNDLTSLFYKFDLVRNTYSYNDVQPWGPGWCHALGWDLGSRDDMALVIWGWHPSHVGLYEVFSWKKPGALSPEIEAVITEQEKTRGLNFIVQVADTGGGGRTYVEDYMSRYARRFEAAKKTDKYDHVRMFNDELYIGHIKLRLGSVYQQEIQGLMRDVDWPPEDKPDAKPREDPRSPNHCSDAGLYAWRGCWHFVKPPVIDEKPIRGSEREVDEYVNKLDKAAKNLQKEGSDPFENTQWSDFDQDL